MAADEKGMKRRGRGKKTGPEMAEGGRERRNEEVAYGWKMRKIYRGKKGEM